LVAIDFKLIQPGSIKDVSPFSGVHFDVTGILRAERYRNDTAFARGRAIHSIPGAVIRGKLDGITGGVI
jgi:hypothetical protein